MALTERPHEHQEPDVEGFQARPEGAVMDPASPDAQSTNGTETPHAPEDPGVFSSPENGHNAIDQPYHTATDETGAVIAPEAEGHPAVNSIAEAAALYLKNNASEQPTETPPASSTDLDTIEPKPFAAPVNVIPASAEAIAMPPVTDTSAEPTTETEEVTTPPPAPELKMTPTETPVVTPPNETIPTVHANPNKKRRRGIVAGVAAAVAGVAAVAGLGFMKSGPAESEQVSAGPVPTADGEAPTTQDSTPQTSTETPETTPSTNPESGEGILGHKVGFNELTPFNTDPEYGTESIDSDRRAAAEAAKDLRDWGLNVASDALVEKTSAGEKVDQNFGVCVSYSEYFDGADGKKHHNRVFFVNPVSYSSGSKTMYHVEDSTGSGMVVEEVLPSGEVRVGGGFQNFTVDKISGFSGPITATVQRRAANHSGPLEPGESPLTATTSAGKTNVGEAVYVYDAEELAMDSQKRQEFCTALLEKANTPKS